MRHESIILPFSKARLLQLCRAVERLAGWCRWRCPLGVLLFILAGHLFHAPFWWRMTCDSFAAIFFVLIFFSYGFTIAIGAIIVKRPRRWFERIGMSFGVLGGVGIAALGIVGAWMLLKGSIHGL